jgi:exopolysaccharide biosynthesis predicted pyruvyltransferase EpsI
MRNDKSKLSIQSIYKGIPDFTVFSRRNKQSYGLIIDKYQAHNTTIQ